MLFTCAACGARNEVDPRLGGNLVRCDQCCRIVRAGNAFGKAPDWLKPGSYEAGAMAGPSPQRRVLGVLAGTLLTVVIAAWIVTQHLPFPLN